MPKVKQISTNCYEYQCACGNTISLEWDERDPPPEKLVKCFECGKKESEEKKCQESITSAQNAAKK